MLASSLGKILNSTRSVDVLLCRMYPYTCVTKVTSSVRYDSSSASSAATPVEQQPFSGEIPIDELKVSFSRSSGQNVNKVATKVEVRFNVEKASWIPEWVKPKLLEKEKNRITKHGELVITSDKTRKQILNQADCLNRIRTLIFDACKKPKEPTPEEIAHKERRAKRRAAMILASKRFDSLKKATRGAQNME